LKETSDVIFTVHRKNVVAGSSRT